MFAAEGGIRVPLILRYPPLTKDSAVAGNGIDHTFASVMDIAPTLLQLAGIPHPAALSTPPMYKNREVVPMRGVSWLPYLSGAAKTVHADDSIHGWELFGRMAVRRGKFKALFIPEPYGPERWQLFDLESDPGETKDLVEGGGDEGMSDLLGELVVAWEGYVVEVGVQGEAPGYGTLVVD